MRRGLSRACVMVPALMCFLLAHGLPGQQAERNPASPFLDAATRCARHLILLSHKQGERLSWPPTETEGASATADLYHGMAAGVLLLGLLEELGVDAARRACPPALKYLEIAVSDPRVHAGLYTGDAGVAWTLLELHRLDPEPGLEKTIRGVVRSIAGTAVRTKQGAHFGTGTDIVSGAAGTGLFLLRAHEQLGSAAALEVARETGRWLVHNAIPAGDGLKWKVTGRTRRVYPNFSHGTAGVGLFLLRLHAATKDASFKQAALKAARYLEARVLEADGGCAWYHHEDDEEGLIYVSWCHGPPGTARFYEELFRQTGEKRWRDRVLACGEWLLESGIPLPRRPLAGYWNNSACCGDAGIGDFYCDLHVATGDPRWLHAAARIGSHLIHVARTTDGALAWPQAEHRVRPSNKQVQTGWAQGSAGIGLFLLRLHLLKAGRKAPVWQFPDNPFPTLR